MGGLLAPGQRSQPYSLCSPSLLCICRPPIPSLEVKIPLHDEAGKPELPVWAQWGFWHCLDCAECAVTVSLHRYSVSPAGLREHSACSGFVSKVTLSSTLPI